MNIPEWGEKAVGMARAGSNVPKIAKEVGADYWDVWNHVRSAEGTEFVGWRGAKWMATNRLNKLVSEKDPEERKELKEQAAECVDYLYKHGQRLSREIERIRKIVAH